MRRKGEGEREIKKGSYSPTLRFSDSPIKFALIYPNSYYLGMSNLGFQSIYYELNQRPDTYCDRVFLNGTAPEGGRRKAEGGSKEEVFTSAICFDRNSRLLFTQHDLREFDILGFSISFENDYFNIPKILNLAKIPPKASLRAENYPLVIAGGISISYNPEPLADFVDAFVIGEAEINIHNLLSTYKAWKENHLPKQTLLKELTQLDGIYVPSFYDIEYDADGMVKAIHEVIVERSEAVHEVTAERSEHIRTRGQGGKEARGQEGKRASLRKSEVGSRKSEVKDLILPPSAFRLPPSDGAPAKIKAGVIENIDDIETSSKILTDNTEFANTYLIEIARGCGRQCRFCVADYTRRPPRYRSLENTIQLAKQAKGHTNRIGLLGAAVSDHPQIDEIAQNLVNPPFPPFGKGGEGGFRISCASLRIETVRPPLLDALAESGQNTITIAPEVATERLQKVINKPIEISQLHYVFEEALKRNIFNIKLYFMIGVPSETEADIEAIVEMVSTLRNIMLPYAKKHGRIGKLICTISPFVPKPHTPFQWSQMEDAKIISRKLNFLKRHLNQLGSVQMSSASARLANIEGVLARGDRRLGPVIYDVAINGLPWNKALRKHGIDANFYTQRERTLDEILPWSLIDLGVYPEYLQSEYTKSRKTILTSACQTSVCKKCGACR